MNALSFFIRIGSFAIVLWNVGAQAQDQKPRWEPVPKGMVLTRNFMVPDSPNKDGYQVLPQKYKLGSKAYAKAPPKWWLKIVDDAKIGDKWHPKDFPLAYAGQFESKNGNVTVLIVQASQAFTGDGFWSPGPEVYLIARLFATKDDAFTLTKEKAFSIGSMQFGRLMAGEANERQIVFQTDGGQEFNSRTITWKRNWTLSVGDDNSLSIKKSD